jgi:hypothetical protein
MSDSSPRQTVKARRKQKMGETTTTTQPTTPTTPLSGDDLEWRRKYEQAVRKRRNSGAAINSNGPLSPSTPSSHAASSQADMDFILAPTYETFDTADQQPLSVSSNYSADSILRRVEAEIASARKAANFIKTSSNNNIGNQSHQQQQRGGDVLDNDDGDDDDEDMAQILNTDTFHSLQPSLSSADDSSKNRALDLIRDEFQEEMGNVEVVGFEVASATTTPQAVTTPINPNQLYFTDEEWQTNDVEVPLNGHETFVRDEKKEEIPDSSRTSPQPKRAELPFDTPTRSNGRYRNRHPKSPRSPRHREPPSLASLHRDPDGDYDASPTPPRLSLLQQRSPSSPRSKTISPDTNRATLSSPKDKRSFLAPSNLTPAMTRTRELLDSLKEQRESIVRSPQQANANRSPPTPVAAGADQQHGASVDASSPPPSQSSPRSPNQSFTRARQAKERVKTSSRGRPSREEPKAETAPTAVVEHQNSRLATSLPLPSLNGDTSHSSRILERRTEVDKGREASTPVLQQQPLQSQSQPKSSLANESVQPNREQTRDNTENGMTSRVDGKIPSSDVVAEASRRIRFRNPFPVIKPPVVRRDLETIIQEHALVVPEMPIRWVKPKKELKQLIVAAMGTSLPRRSNACGALKVLTRHEKNQMSLVRTDGFLSALIFAASQSVLDVDTDLAIDARTRAVACLKNVCGPKENRIVVFHHPGVVECLVKVVRQDAGEGRSLAAASIALLAKTPACREGLAQVEGLVDIFANVMASAATLISEEALQVRLNPSPRSGKKLDDSVSEVSFRTGNDRDDGSILTDSSSISSSEDQELPSVVTSKAETIKPVDSIKNQTEERQEEFINHARSNACAALLHISKQCATSVRGRFLYTCTRTTNLFRLSSLMIARFSPSCSFIASIGDE